MDTPRPSKRSTLALALLLVGCDPSMPDLLVDLRTDLRPGYDFRAVETRVVEAPAAARRGWATLVEARREDDFVAGRRIAELVDVEPGRYALEVRLIGDDIRVPPRTVRVEVEGTTAVTAVISRACDGVRCPGPDDALDATECSAGRCVPPECTPDRPEACPEVGCQIDGECEGGGGCVVPRCVEGECFEVPTDSACDGETYCDGESGACLPIPPESDAGPLVLDGSVGRLDGGPVGVDAGPVEECPGGCDDGDPCTRDLCVDGACQNPPGCTAPTDYCLAGACHPRPVVDFETLGPGGDGCVDLGVTHDADGDFAYRRTTTGRPNATVTQRNEHVSCGAPIEDADVYTLDASGRDVETLNTGAVRDCFFAIYGLWRVRAVVDGLVSDFEEIVYFNSTCSGVRTCAEARSFCSPCADCGDAEYCADAAGCAPNPTLTVETSDGPGCVDLGVPHTDSPAINVIITGRPNAVSTQFNEHISCGTPEMAAEMRDLDPTGRVEDPLFTGAAPCDNVVYGRWNIEAEVDGVRSNTAQVVYYNSGCPGIRTCAEASGYCG